MKTVLTLLAFTFAHSISSPGAVIYDARDRVVGSVILDPFGIVNGPRTLDLEINGDGRIDLTLTTFINGFGDQVIHVRDTPVSTRFLYSSESVAALGEGQEIGSLLGDSTLEFRLISSLGSHSLSSNVQNIGFGEFFGETAYLGFEFQADSGTHYGYALLKDYNANGMIVEGVAWETTLNKAILAGAIPEPTTSLLLGVVVVLSVGRRKREGLFPGLGCNDPNGSNRMGQENGGI
ncbi:MAG: PEP-CTERM sorting domain-containing protein [Akkermansiaceae bacterium]